MSETDGDPNGRIAAALPDVLRLAEKMPGDTPLDRARMLRIVVNAYIEAIERARRATGGTHAES